MAENIVQDVAENKVQDENNVVSKSKMKRESVITYYNRGRFLVYVKQNSVLAFPNLTGSGYSYLGPGLHLANPLKTSIEINGEDDKFTISFPSLLRTASSNNGSVANQGNSNDHLDISEGAEVKVGDVTVYYRVSGINRSLPTLEEYKLEYESDFRKHNKMRTNEDLLEYEKWIEDEMNSFSVRRTIRKLYKTKVRNYLKSHSIDSVGNFVSQGNAIEQTKTMLKEVIIKIINNSTIEELKSKIKISRNSLPDYLSDELNIEIVERLDYIMGTYGIEIISFGIGDVDLPEEIRKAVHDRKVKAIENATNLERAKSEAEIAQLQAKRDKLLKGVDWELLGEAIRAGQLNAEQTARVLTRHLTKDGATLIEGNGMGSMGISPDIMLLAQRFYAQHAPNTALNQSPDVQNTDGHARSMGNR